MVELAKVWDDYYNCCDPCMDCSDLQLMRTEKESLIQHWLSPAIPSHSDISLHLFSAAALAIFFSLGWKYAIRYLYIYIYTANIKSNIYI